MKNDIIVNGHRIKVCSTTKRLDVKANIATLEKCNGDKIRYMRNGKISKTYSSGLVVNYNSNGLCTEFFSPIMQARKNYIEKLKL